MSVLRYSARIGETGVLGPGRRAVIWVHGCCFHCEGCIAENFKKGSGRVTTPEEMADWYGSQGADGLTISGGEPMLQPGPLAETVERIRAAADCGVIVYTGFVYEELLKRAETEADLRRFLGDIDLLIDGPYVRALDDARPYRGSSNQRLLPLTDRYRSALETYYNAATARQMEIRLSGSYTLMVGVPGPEQTAIWEKIKEMGEKHGADLEA